MNIGQECSTSPLNNPTEECYKVTKANDVLKVIVSELLARAKQGDSGSWDILNKAFSKSGDFNSKVGGGA